MDPKQVRMITQTQWQNVKRIDFHSVAADYIKPQEAAVGYDHGDPRHAWEKSRVNFYFRVSLGTPPVCVRAEISDNGDLAFNEPQDKEIEKLCDKFYRETLTMQKTVEPDKANTFALNEMI